ncbi:16S rRNA (guanine(966)-N(2))-methyltransferase RsmD [Sansalvadorimonas verongulae]|uniref:16S rRNA (guanine(966)-N(2))-methyltransferase RsmD n=1 Tax=Sansalvadorimonas verongulae TaxID=2172824 RepID=UPI0012BBB0E6|nr:16S rRNA (guanine(966)-N(2))-methyltransferase RsmD [Sansalvadorimonas verongulae]MTI13410.1 16S rRNA (guanine(966)-N(2))-methyltransferase RsmD [Sansalvadorimonas verongulae]
MSRSHKSRKPRPQTSCRASGQQTGQHSGAGKLRIIGGEWRSRLLPVASVEGLRPTPNRIRETLYSWLTGWVPGARCLDAFSGTGALGLEALSRGAKHATFLEYSPIAAKTLQSNLTTLKCTTAEVVHTDASRWLSQTAKTPYNLVFLDPPFHKGFVAPVCHLLASNGYLTENSLVYIESEVELGQPDVPENWQLWKEKTAGQVTCRLYRVNE